MFNNFFYKLREVGIPVSPTAFLTFHKALKLGMVSSLDDFYTIARSVLIKSERHFDLYDQLFAHYFEGAELPDVESLEFENIARAILEEWLKNPHAINDALGLNQEDLEKLSPDELLELFKKKLKEQTERHDEGDEWIGTGGTSPFGHSGRRPGGLRIGGVSKNKSAIKVANERRFKDYSGQGPLTSASIGEALKRLRHLVPAGPKDTLNIDETIYQTVKRGGEIELIFDSDLRDRLKVILAIDNGGWSMDPYVSVVQTLFDYARAQFKDLKTYYFHNTIYDTIWKDPGRVKKPKRIEEFTRLDPDIRLILVGDASMAPYELFAENGSIYANERSGSPGIDRLQFLAKTFPHCVWLNPVSEHVWSYTQTIRSIGMVIPMFPLSLDGLESAVGHLMKRF